MKEFVTAVKATEAEKEGEEWLEFPIREVNDKQETIRVVQCRAKPPTPGQAAYLSMTTHKRASQESKIAGVINFVMAIMDDETAAYLSDRLLDAQDPFELEQIQDIVEELIAEWSGRPTELPPDSAPSGGSTTESSTEATSETEKSLTSASTAT